MADEAKEHDGAYDALDSVGFWLDTLEDARVANEVHPLFKKQAGVPHCPCACGEDDLANLSDDDGSSSGWASSDYATKNYATKAPKTGTRKRNRSGKKDRKFRALDQGAKLEGLREIEKNKSDKFLRNAFLNCTVFDNLSLRDLVERKKAGKARRWPRKLQNADVLWNQDQPHIAVDKDDLPLAVHLPNFVGPLGRRRLYRALRAFGQDVGVKFRRGADAGKRDSIKGYPYIDNKNYINGIFQLVGAWTAIGHPDDEPVPAGDVLKNGRTFRLALNLLREMEFWSSILDHVLSKLDAAAYNVLHHARASLAQQNGAYAAVSSIDPTYMHGRSISYNRATRNHEDSRDPPEAWTPILVLGKFKSGGELYIKKLGLKMSYRPGTLIFIRGAVLPHEVLFFYGGQRISIAHFVHKAVLAQVGVKDIPISSYKESAYYSVPSTLGDQK